jgi:predicted RNA binding protein YcfA (HicA-like mRNA interferase family)
MKIAEVLRKLLADGWYLHTTRGSHRQYKHASKKGRVTVAGKPSDDLAPGTVNSIYKQVENEIREAIKFHIEGMKEDGLPTPAPRSAVEYIEVAA